MYNINIILVSQDGFIEEKYDKYDVRGIFSQRERIEYVEAYNRKNIVKNYLDKGIDPKYLEGYTDETLSLRLSICTFIHETTHALDYIISNTSKSEKFIKIFDEEWEQYMLTTHFNFENKKVINNINKPEEFFASAMVSYILYPEELQKYCPKTYLYINSIIVYFQNNELVYQK